MLSIILLIILTALCIFIAVKFSELRLAFGIILSVVIILLINSMLYERYRIPIGYFGILPNSSEWSKTDQTVFIDNCVDGASVSMTRSEASKYCNCVLNDLMEDYDTPEDALNVDAFSYAIECL
jgi:hypothetical protein